MKCPDFSQSFVICSYFVHILSMTCKPCWIHRRIRHSSTRRGKRCYTSSMQFTVARHLALGWHAVGMEHDGTVTELSCLNWAVVMLWTDVKWCEVFEVSESPPLARQLLCDVDGKASEASAQRWWPCFCGGGSWWGRLLCSRSPRDGLVGGRREILCGGSLVRENRANEECTEIWPLSGHPKCGSFEKLATKQVECWRMKAWILFSLMPSTPLSMSPCTWRSSGPRSDPVFINGYWMMVWWVWCWAVSLLSCYPAKIQSVLGMEKLPSKLRGV